MNHHTRLTLTTRAIAVCLVLIVAEILHAIARSILLVPHVGEFRSNQIGVFTGSIRCSRGRWSHFGRKTTTGRDDLYRECLPC